MNSGRVVRAAILLAVALYAGALLVLAARGGVPDLAVAGAGILIFVVLAALLRPRA